MESWRLKDDLYLEDFGGLWPANSELLEGAELALFRRIQSYAQLRALFLTIAAGGSTSLCPNATCPGILQEGARLVPYPTGSTAPGTRLALYHLAEYCSITPYGYMGEASNALYPVSQRPAAV